MLWQNSRLAVLWDVSYILENATRIAEGDVPCRDFVLPYAPLTFVKQAAIIRLFGRDYALEIAYAMIACAVATAMTYTIMRLLGARLSVATLLTAPLTFLGIYCVLPHPFYDPDCCFAVLFALLLFLIGEKTQSQTIDLLAGVASVVPLFVKQNIGLPFLIAVVLALLVTRHAAALAGVASALTIAIIAIAATCGINNYIRWTVRFAAQRRLPPIAEYFAMYNDDTLWWWLAVAIVGVFVMRRWRIAGGLIVSIPWIWSAVDFFLADDPLEFEENLIRLWPLMIVVAIVCFLLPRNRRVSIACTLAAILGAFLSQQAWGSSYGIWPLLMILIAFVLPDGAIVAFIVSATMLLQAVPYVAGNNRLTYAKVAQGEPRHSTLAPLRGLTIRGDWLPQFDELVAWTDQHIPRNDAILCLPGEDLFYFATGRRPRVPVVMFDRTINPYSAAEIASWNVQWVIVKRQLQINGTPMSDLNDVLAAMRARLRLVARLRNYDIYESVIPSVARNLGGRVPPPRRPGSSLRSE